MSERYPRVEQRLLLDLQVIQGATPAPAAAPSGGWRPRRRYNMLDWEMAAVLRVLGILSDSELAALMAQT